MKKKHSTTNRPLISARQRGFTLIEIMVVVVIIGMLVTLILPKVLDRQDQAAQVKAIADINALSSAIKII